MALTEPETPATTVSRPAIRRTVAPTVDWAMVVEASDLIRFHTGVTVDRAVVTDARPLVIPNVAAVVVRADVIAAIPRVTDKGVVPEPEPGAMAI